MSKIIEITDEAAAMAACPNAAVERRAQIAYMQHLIDEALESGISSMSLEEIRAEARVQAVP
jgi:hypothetical protein